LSRRKRKSSELASHVRSTALALVGGPKLAAGVKALIFAHRGISERRLEKLWQHVLRGENDPQGFSERIAKAVLKDGDAVGFAFIAAARAAVNAVDPCALSSIGLLARRFVQTQTPSRREYAAYLNMFESLDATEYGVLRHVVRTLARADGDRVHTTTYYNMDNVPGPHWMLIGNVMLARGAPALQLIRGFEDILEARGVLGMSESSPAVPREVIDLLLEVVPNVD
jgi:hypothetical protein